MRIPFYRHARVAALTVIAGTAFQLGGCFSGASNLLRDFNPCGTILNCDPNTYRLAASGYEGPGADPDVDPFCTWPGLCPGTVDPFAPGGAGQ